MIKIVNISIFYLIYKIKVKYLYIIFNFLKDSNFKNIFFKESNNFFCLNTIY